MKLNISCPLTGQQKAIVIDDDKKLSIFYGRRMGQEVDADALGDEFKGYVFKITGGNDKDGFAMKQGVLVQGRVRLLMSKGHKTYRPRRAGERKRKSVRGCVVGPDLSVIALAISKVGDQQIAGLTDTKLPKRLGPKRATRIRKLFALTKDDDVRRYVIRRKIEKEGKKTRVKAPKIQRLVTDARLRRKRVYLKHKKARRERTSKAIADYKKVLDEFHKKKAAHLREEAQHKKDLLHQAAAKKAAVHTTTSAPGGKPSAPVNTQKAAAATTKPAQAPAKPTPQTQTQTQQKPAAGKPAQAPAQPAGKQTAAPAAPAQKKPAGGKKN